MALTDKLTAIAAAIREKSGTSALLTLDAMPGAIAAIETGGGSGGGISEDNLVLTGNCSVRFRNGGWDWFIEDYGDKITSKNITDLNSMFNGSKVEEIPFTINAPTNADWQYAFNNMNNVKYIAPIPVLNTNMASYLFGQCHNLRYLPEVEKLTISKTTTAGMNCVIYNCYSLREISDKWIENITGNLGITSSYSHPYKEFLYGCYALDEVKNIRVNNEKEFTSNMFTSAFGNCSRVKDITFATNSAGTPYAVKWKNQTIALNAGTGWLVHPDNYMIGYNSGINTDKRVTNDEEYAALKNDPDWWSSNAYYSRFNHDSAVNLINTLPNTSSYLATSGGTNTIQFRNDAGTLTDGGSCGSLTEEEIAVAVAKGWTITYKT